MDEPTRKAIHGAIEQYHRDVVAAMQRCVAALEATGLPQPWPDELAWAIRPDRGTGPAGELAQPRPHPLRPLPPFVVAPYPHWAVEFRDLFAEASDLPFGAHGIRRSPDSANRDRRDGTQEAACDAATDPADKAEDARPDRDEREDEKPKGLRVTGALP
jgi:hypothetical protein